MVILMLQSFYDFTVNAPVWSELHMLKKNLILKTPTQQYTVTVIAPHAGQWKSAFCDELCLFCLFMSGEANAGTRINMFTPCRTHP